MLEELKVKNVALIREAELSFDTGLNILTGETGAGKSILIDSILLALGNRADKGLIAQGAEHAYVELTFRVDDEALGKKLAELGAQTEDGRLILTRRVDRDKSVCRINGEVVSARVMQQAASLLIDLHGQQENTQLLREKKHRELLDLYCGEELAKVKKKLAAAYEDYTALLEKQSEAQKLDGNSQRELDLARFELSEIEDAGLSEGEDETLETEFAKLSNAAQIFEGAARAKEYLDAQEGDALSLIGNALASLKEVEKYDPFFTDLIESLLQCEESVRESARSISRYLDREKPDEGRLYEVSARLDLINRLKHKYDTDLSGVLEHAKEQQRRIGELEDYDAYLEELRVNLAKAKEALLALCDQAHGIREKGAKAFSEKLCASLTELGFTHADFSIVAQQSENALSAQGNDQVSFHVCLNAGEKLRPLTEVASGGELSRIMLAIKSIMAQEDEIPTLIFDEIDAGISGQTAWKVAEKMALIGKHRQLLCITHLPQIAAMADRHFRIEKNEKQDETQTQITALDGGGMIDEIARLLGSDEITESARSNAEELKERAAKAKKSAH